jgi:hypothetical protein
MVASDGVEHIRVNELKRCVVVDQAWKCNCFVAETKFVNNEDCSYTAFTYCSNCDKVSWTKYKYIEIWL